MDLNRREFVQTAAAGASLVLGGQVLAQNAAAGGKITVGLLGTGVQGSRLMLDCLKIPGVRFVAVCDLWKQQNLRRAKGRLRAKKQPVNAYTDYREMLAKETDMDAVIVATPDCWHAEHAIACLEAGKHVYCEKEMSNTLEDAQNMVTAGRKSPKMFQIGHQRRSNPVYALAREALQKESICGRLTYCYGQWNRGVQDYVALPEKRRAKLEIPADVLQKYGYENMEQFLNWRWFRKYSSGPIADLGSHQIDIFSWFLGCDPERVVAMGSTDYFQREWFEDVLCTYEYKTTQNGKKGSARAFYQILNTNSCGHYFERFSGDGGALTISENEKKCYFIPEPGKAVPTWMEGVEPIVRDGVGNAIPLLPAFAAKGAEAAEAMKQFAAKSVHQLHLENFFHAVRKNDKSILTCDPEEAYATAVAVLNVIPAVEAGGGKAFQPGDFKA
ncbi:MAG: Gfo/Idh/MocA family oxidoreductase [Lentisphaeria bacterium]|nr:Gfo/Idh/MocA family oxidoreductase [Lentisphaeria bacterium]